MTETVINNLEIVQIQHANGHKVAASLGPSQSVGKSIDKERAVWQPRQRIVQGLMCQFLLQRLALGDVAAGEHDAADAGLGGQVIGDNLARAPASADVQQAGLAEHIDTGGRRRPFEDLADAAVVVGMDMLTQWLAGKRIRLESPIALGGRVDKV